MSAAMTSSPDKPAPTTGGRAPGKSKDHIAEIDTLRAVSVLLVILFHAFPTVAPGGFIGVDVFFVISGFVISRAYLDRLVSRETTLSQFYVARFRRLAPAMFVVFAVTAVLSAVILTPERLTAFAWSLAAQPFYLQNFVFWVEGDYFSGGLTKPLLHTWSLAVEEQFYIFWAFAILFFRRFPKTVLAVVIAMGLASIAMGFLLETRTPKTVFFMLPTRMWEFSIGIAAYLATRRSTGLNPLLGTIVAGLCIMVVVVTGMTFGEDSAFPGVQSIIACVAVGVALFCFDQAGGVMPGFAFPPLRYIGRISYGLYLWHWPPLVLFYMQTGRAAEPVEAAVLMAIALGGASASYHLVENPIRRGRMIGSSGGIIRMVVAGSVTIAAVALVLIRTDGLVLRYPKEIQPYFAAAGERGAFRCSRLHVLLNPADEFCPLTTSAPGQGGGVLILGDSHADVLKELLADVGKSTGIPVFLTVRNCDLGRFGTFAFCSDGVLDNVIVQAKAAGVTDVVAISNWEMDKFSIDSMRKDIARLTGAGLKVHVMEVVPNDPSYDPIERAQAALEGGPLRADGISLDSYRRSTQAQRELISRVVAEFPGQATVLAPADYLCRGGACAYSHSGIPYYLDSNHLTFSGAEVLRPMFGGLFSAIALEAGGRSTAAAPAR